MEIQVRAYTQADLPALIRIWNEVVKDGVAFPQEELLDASSGAAFFAEQTCTAVAEDRQTGHIYGLYILHPNNIGRCGHVANASFAVAGASRGEGIGRLLVEDCLRQAAACGFRGLQFNAVVASNERARSLYESLGFARIGMIPGGFCNKDDVYEDMYIYYHPTV